MPAKKKPSAREAARSANAPAGKATARKVAAKRSSGGKAGASRCSAKCPHCDVGKCDEHVKPGPGDLVYHKCNFCGKHWVV